LGGGCVAVKLIIQVSYETSRVFGSDWYMACT